MIIHATAVARRTAHGPRAALLLGPSGAGKSLLAVTLAARAWLLVADDRVALTRASGLWLAAPPPALAGLHEHRGVGVLPAPHLASAPVSLVLDLAAPADRVTVPTPWGDAHPDAPAPDLPYMGFDPAAPAATERLEAAFTRAITPP